ncbi:MAG: DUF6968 family protein [bacterium]
MKLAPISVKMTPVIAQRDLVLVVAGKRCLVRIRIGRPVQDVDTAHGLDWRCPITVSGVGHTRSQRGLGADSLQALVHALKLVEEEIEHLETRTSGRLEWFGERWHGLPSIRLAEPPVPKRPRVGRTTSVRMQRDIPRG